MRHSARTRGETLTRNNCQLTLIWQFYMRRKIANARKPIKYQYWLQWLLTGKIILRFLYSVFYFEDILIFIEERHIKHVTNLEIFTKRILILLKATAKFAFFFLQLIRLRTLFPRFLANWINREKCCNYRWFHIELSQAKQYKIHTLRANAPTARRTRSTLIIT